MLCDGEEHLLLFLPPRAVRDFACRTQARRMAAAETLPTGIPRPALLSRPRHSDDGVQFSCVADLLMPVDDAEAFYFVT